MDMPVYGKPLSVPSNRLWTHNIDTGSANGKFFFHIMSSFSELERELIRERTHIGLSSARARGKVGGRPETHQQDKKEIAYLYS